MELTQASALFALRHGSAMSGQLVSHMAPTVGRRLTLPLAEPPGRKSRVKCLRHGTVEWAIRTSYANDKGITNPLSICFVPNKKPAQKTNITSITNIYLPRWSSMRHKDGILLGLQGKIFDLRLILNS